MQHGRTSPTSVKSNVLVGTVIHSAQHGSRNPRALKSRNCVGRIQEKNKTILINLAYEIVIAIF